MRRHIIPAIVLIFFLLFSSIYAQSKGGLPMKSTIIYHYELTDQQRILGSIFNGVKNTHHTEISSVMNIKLDYIIELKKMGGCVVRIRFDSISKHGDLSQIAGDNPTGDPLFSDASNKSLEAFSGAVFNLSLDINGKIKTMDGYQSFKKRYWKIYEEMMKSEKDELAIKNKITSIPYTENYFKNLFEVFSRFLSVNGMTANKQWREKTFVNIGDSRTRLTSFNCYKIENGIAYIKTHAKVDEPMNPKSPADRIKGIEEGEIELDANTGMIIKFTKDFTQHGEKAMGKSKYSMTNTKTTAINGTRILVPLEYEHNAMFTGAGSAEKELSVKGVTHIRLGYEFYKDADQLKVEDQNGRELFITKTTSTTVEQFTIIPAGDVSKLVFKIKSDSPNSRWKLNVEY